MQQHDLLEFVLDAFAELANPARGCRSHGQPGVVGRGQPYTSVNTNGPNIRNDMA